MDAFTPIKLYSKLSGDVADKCYHIHKVTTFVSHKTDDPDRFPCMSNNAILKCALFETPGIKRALLQFSEL